MFLAGPADIVVAYFGIACCARVDAAERQSYDGDLRTALAMIQARDGDEWGGVVLKTQKCGLYLHF